MRIAHIIEACGGGSGQVALDLVTCGAAAGDDITLIYAPERADVQFLAGLKQLPVSVTQRPLAMRRAVGWWDAVSAWKLYKYLRKHPHFDVIHSHSSKAGALARIVGIAFPATRQVYTPHAFVTMGGRTSARLTYGLIERALSFLCSRISCVSQAEYDHARDTLHIAQGKLVLIPNGISLPPEDSIGKDRAEQRRRLTINNQDCLVGFVGRLEQQKNPLRMLEAFHLAAQENAQLKLVMVGDGSLRAKCESYIAHHKLGAQVKMLGALPVRSIMPAFDCLVCSSDYEGHSLAIAEAMSAHVPVLSTPVGEFASNTNLIPPGYRVEDFTPKALARAVQSFAALNEQRRLAAGQEARRYAEQFSLDAMHARYHTLYERITRPRFMHAAAARLSALFVLVALSSLSMAQPLYAAELSWGINGHPIKGSAYADYGAQFRILRDNHLGTYRFDVPLTQDAMSLAVRKMRELSRLAKEYHIALRPVLLPPYTWGDRTDAGRYPAGDSQALYHQGYDRALAFVQQFKDDIPDWELGNEVNLNIRTDNSGKPIYSGGTKPEDFENARAYDWAQVLKGMSDAIGTTNANSHLRLRRILGTTTSHFGFLDFMQGQGVEYDVIGYHTYPRASNNLDDIFRTLASYKKPVHITEVNTGIITEPGYENQDRAPHTQAGNADLRLILEQIKAQDAANIEEVDIYELLDEPDKAGAEANFGLLHDPATTKAALEIVKEMATIAVH